MTPNELRKLIDAARRENEAREFTGDIAALHSALSRLAEPLLALWEAAEDSIGQQTVPWTPLVDALKALRSPGGSR